MINTQQPLITLTNTDTSSEKIQETNHTTTNVITTTTTTNPRSGDAVHQEHFISEYQFEGFEGPEKKIELEFRYKRSPNQSKQDYYRFLNENRSGLRQLTASQWQSQLLDDVHCQIISQTSNQHFDSYVLSESSLFVYPFKLILKTCGTTTLLHAIEPLLRIAQQLNMVIDFCWFSRKNYVFPQKQLAPHTSWEDEVTHLNKYFPNGNGFIVGPMSKDHWYLFLADYRGSMDEDESLDCNTPIVHTSQQPDQTFEILMHELSSEKMKQFFKDEHFISAEHVTEKSGIAGLIPGSTIDAFQFDPCGYSMNGLFGDSYWTIHITPEDSCSFASFETNYLPEKGAAYYSELTRKVLNVFKPGRFSVTLLADDHVPINRHGIDLDLRHDKSLAAFSLLHLPNYTQLSKSFYEFEGGFNMTFCSFRKTSDAMFSREKKLAELVISSAKKHKAALLTANLPIVASQDDFVADSSSDTDEKDNNPVVRSPISIH